MKSSFLILISGLLFLSNSVYGQTKEEKKQLAKFITTTTYGVHESLNLNKSLINNWGNDNLAYSPYEPPVGLSQPEAEAKRMAQIMQQLAFDHENNGTVWLRFSPKAYPKDKIPYEISFIFKELLDNRGNNIITPFTEKTYSHENTSLSRSFINDEEYESINLDLLNSDNPLYQIKGDIKIKLPTVIEHTLIPAQVGAINFGQYASQLVKVTDAGIVMRSNTNNDSYEVIFLNGKKQKLSRSILSVEEDNFLLKYFTKQNRAFTEQELDKIADTLQIERLKSVSATNSPTIQIISTPEAIKYLAISKKPSFETFTFPFQQVATEGVLLGKPVLFSSLTDKKMFYTTFPESFEDTQDVTLVEEVSLGEGNTMELSTDNFGQIALESLPVGLKSFKGLRRLQMMLSSKANVADFFSQLGTNQLGLTSLDIQAAVIPTDEGDSSLVAGIIEVPTTIGSLKNLKDLTLVDHYISNLPGDIEKLSNLESVNLSGNLFTSFPESLLKCPKLELIDLSDNYLTSIPPAVCQMPNLKVLRLSLNNLEALPACLFKKESLTELDISTNFLANYFKQNAAIKTSEVVYGRDNQSNDVVTDKTSKKDSYEEKVRLVKK